MERVMISAVSRETFINTKTKIYPFAMLYLTTLYCNIKNGTNKSK